MIFLIYIAAFLIGTSLGLIGGGGSILTVPVLVYMLGMNPLAATGYSLFVVGSAALIGAINNFRKGFVSLKTAFIFAIPSFIAVYITRLFLLPAIPDKLFTINNFVLTKDLFIMVFFAMVMILAAISMIKSKSRENMEAKAGDLTLNYPLIVLEGFAVGVLTGVVGAGGGFLIIPALVLLAKLPMKLAVGTSLFIIAIKSLFGFIGDWQAGLLIDWSVLLPFTVFAVLGIFLGGYLSNFIPGKKLKSGFGWMVLIMAFIILIKELIIK